MVAESVPPLLRPNSSERSGEKAMKNTCTNHCAGCVHYRLLANKRGAGPKVCHYILDTGQKRGCAASNCTINRNKKRTTKRSAI